MHDKDVVLKTERGGTLMVVHGARNITGCVGYLRSSIIHHLLYSKYLPLHNESALESRIQNIE